MNEHQDRVFSGFSLVEVVVAVGLFAFAIVGVLGLLSPTGRAIADVTDNDAASRAISAIQDGLQRAGWAAVQANLLAASPTDTQYPFAVSRGGEKVGIKSGTGSASPFPNDEPGRGEQFFEFALVRDTNLSPAANDNTAGFLAFTIVLRWPAYLPNGLPVTTPSQKSVLVVPAAITR